MIRSKEPIGSPLDWSSLTDDEQRVLQGALDAQPLDRVWAIFMPETEREMFNRGYKYVPQLARATWSALLRGDVVVSERDSSGKKYSELSMDAAKAILSDLDNWWTYDPSDASDPDDPGVNPVKDGGGLAASQYYLSVRSVAREIVNYAEPSRIETAVPPGRSVGRAISLTSRYFQVRG